MVHTQTLHGTLINGQAIRLPGATIRLACGDIVVAAAGGVIGINGRTGRFHVVSQSLAEISIEGHPLFDTPNPAVPPRSAPPLNGEPSALPVGADLASPSPHRAQNPIGPAVPPAETEAPVVRLGPGGDYVTDWNPEHGTRNMEHGTETPGSGFRVPGSLLPEAARG